MDLFRAVYAKGEKSDRVLELITEALQGNGGNYTAWYWRRRCLEALGDFSDEFDFSSEWTKDNLKTYQIWYHRRWLVEQTNNPSEELSFTESCLGKDAKNFNSWQHRQWVLENFAISAGTYEHFADDLIEDDCRNNSAWNHRRFLFDRRIRSFLRLKDPKFSSKVYPAFHGVNGDPVIDVDEVMKTVEERFKVDEGFCAWADTVVELFAGENLSRESARYLSWEILGELQFAMKWIEKVPQNESTWNYLSGFFFGGLFGQSRSNFERGAWIPLSSAPTILDELCVNVCEEVSKNTEWNVAKFNRHALSLLANLSFARGRIDEAAEMIGQLALIDPVRKIYWEWHLDRLGIHRN